MTGADEEPPGFVAEEAEGAGHPAVVAEGPSTKMVAFINGRAQQWPQTAAFSNGRGRACGFALASFFAFFRSASGS